MPVPSLARVLAIACTSPDEASAPPLPSIEQGRYLVTIAGCNDCHTSGFAPSGGKVPESEWLRGDLVGCRGPWGTTYASNLRLHLATLTEDQWVTLARGSSARPPMPVWSLHGMKEEDLRSIYRFVRSLLGPAGDPVPRALAPGEAPVGPVLQWPEEPPIAPAGG